MNFICDFCNTAVDENSTSCPKCKLAFSNTRCPICGFIGNTKMFKRGCPKCSKKRTYLLNEENSYVIRKSKQKRKESFFEIFKKFSPLLKFIILIFVINIALVWYITYAVLFK